MLSAWFERYQARSVDVEEKDKIKIAQSKIHRAVILKKLGGGWGEVESMEQAGRHRRFVGWRQRDGKGWVGDKVTTLARYGATAVAGRATKGR